MLCIYTFSDRPFCWGVNKEKGTRNGFCKFLQTPNIVDTNNKRKIFFNCKLENEKLFMSFGKKSCMYYTRTTAKSMDILKKLRTQK